MTNLFDQNFLTIFATTKIANCIGFDTIEINLFEYWIFNVEYWILNVECYPGQAPQRRMLLNNWPIWMEQSLFTNEYWILNVECWILNVEYWTFELSIYARKWNFMISSMITVELQTRLITMRSKPNCFDVVLLLLMLFFCLNKNCY